MTSWQLQVFAVSIRKKAKWRWAKMEVEKALQKPNSAPEAELRCLDIGTGVGTLGYLQEQLGGQWEFTETDHNSAQQARKILKGPVHEINIFDVHLNLNTYDVITVFDVIEHVPDARAFMKRLSELLKPHGTLILTTPADDGKPYFWRSLGERIFGIDQASHGHTVEGFSQDQLEQLCQEAGLINSELTPFSFAFTEMVELAYNGAYILKSRSWQTAGGYNLALSPASESDVSRHRAELTLLKMLYPFLRGISLLDHAFPFKRGYEWGLVAQKAISSDTTEMVLP